MGPPFARGRLAAPKPTSIRQAREPPECAGGKRRPGRSPRHCCRSVICVTSFQGELWFDNLMRWAAGGGKKGGRDGDEGDVTKFKDSSSVRPGDGRRPEPRPFGDRFRNDPGGVDGGVWFGFRLRADRGAVAQRRPRLCTGSHDHGQIGRTRKALSKAACGSDEAERADVLVMYKPLKPAPLRAQLTRYAALREAAE
jgi:hypothetical protein